MGKDGEHLWSYIVHIVNIIKRYSEHVMYRKFVYYMSPIIKICMKHIMYIESGPFSKFLEQLEYKKICKHLMYRESKV
jgi:hypothetical protein